MKAINTIYKGYKFRSRLEARWAVYFDSLGIEFEYEKEGFDLGKGEYYLPDFYLPQVDMWAEVKADSHSIGIKKFFTFAKQSKKVCLLLLGQPDLIPYLGFSGPDLHAEGFALTNYHNYFKEEKRFYSCEEGDETPFTEEANNAVLKSKQARFEHGENK